MSTEVEFLSVYLPACLPVHLAKRLLFWQPHSLFIVKEKEREKRNPSDNLELCRFSEERGKGKWQYPGDTMMGLCVTMLLCARIFIFYVLLLFFLSLRSFISYTLQCLSLLPSYSLLDFS